MSSPKFNACQKSAIFIFLTLISHFSFSTDDCDSVELQLQQKIRYLGDWESNGRPNYLEELGDTISDGLLNFVDLTLPEQMALPEGNPYLNDSVQLNTVITDTSDVYLTFVNEGADWRNSLGFYTYEHGNPPNNFCDIDSFVVIFPNASLNDALDDGDKVYLGKFNPGIVIGYFLIARGWEKDSVTTGIHTVFSNRNLNTFTIPEFQQQTILLNFAEEDRFLLAFEDIKRPAGDNDFNDAVFYLTTSPNSVDTTNIPKFPTAQLTGGGVFCDESPFTSLNVKLFGTPPFDFKIAHNQDTIEYVDVFSKSIDIPVTEPGLYTLIEVQNTVGKGIASGSADYIVNVPDLSFQTEIESCDNEDQIEIPLSYSGVLPWTLNYTINGQESHIDYEDSSVVLTVNAGEEIELQSLVSYGCEKQLSQPIFFDILVSPSASLLGDTLLCGVDQWNVPVSINSSSASTLVFSFNDLLDTLTTSASEGEILIEESGLLALVSIENEFCKSELDEEISVEFKDFSTIEVTFTEASCEVDSSVVQFELIGPGPSIVDFTVNDQENAVEVDNQYSFVVRKDSYIDVVSVSNEFCSQEDTSSSVFVNIPVLPSATLHGEYVLCGDELVDGSVSVEGDGPYSIVYSVNDSVEVEIDTDGPFGITINKESVIKLLSIRNEVCEGSVSGDFSIIDKLQTINTTISAPEVICSGDTVKLEFEADEEYEAIRWLDLGNGDFINEDNVSANYISNTGSSGIVNITVEIEHICGIFTVSRELYQGVVLDPSFDYMPEEIFVDDVVEFIAVNDSYGNDNYAWEFGNGSDGSDFKATSSYELPGFYEVTLTVFDRICEADSTRQIKVKGRNLLYIPNAFDPNSSNSENRVVKVYGTNISEEDFYFRIVNRWGNTIYETTNFSNANTIGWDGSDFKNNEDQSLNVYSYIVRGKFQDGITFNESGSITLLK